MDSNTFMPNMGMGFVPGWNNNYVGQQITKFNNNLTDEEIRSLRQKGPEFCLGLTNDEIIRSGCNHREIGGMKDALTQDPITGEQICSICGERFHILESEISDEAVQKMTNDMVDLINTIKLLYIDLPTSPAREFFQVLPLIKKLPQLYKMACESYSRHDVNSGWRFNNQQPGAMAMFQNMNSMLGSGMMGMPVGGYNPGYMNQGMPQQPMGFNNGYMNQGMPQQPMMGFGYPGAGQQPAYNVNTNNFAYTPQAQATPAATVANAPAAAEVTTTVTA